MHLARSTALHLGLFALAHSSNVVVQVTPKVQITGRRVEAQPYVAEIEKFTGIRFATTPTLFGPAIPVSYDEVAEGTVIDGTLPGAVCSALPPVTLSDKLHSFLDLLYVTNSPTDPLDCLNLDVHRPVREHYHGDLRVVVYVHGGAFKRKTRNQQHNQPEAIYRFDQDTLWVSLSYSMGPQAFWYTDESSNNRAIHEVIYGLLWVHRYIRAFGGDPENVTVIGSMSGATLVEYAMFYLRNYHAFGFQHEPFGKVVLMSALADMYYPLSIPAAHRRQQEFLAKFSPPISHVGQITKEEYMRVAKSFIQYQSPVMDGVNLVGDARKHYDEGLFMRPKAILLTIVADETSLFVLNHFESLKKDDGHVLKLYGYHHLQEAARKELGHLHPIERTVRWMTDVMSVIPFTTFAERLKQLGIPVYQHEFRIYMPRLNNKEHITSHGPEYQRNAELMASLGSYNTVDNLMLFDAPVSANPPMRFESLADREYQRAIFEPLWSFIRSGVAEGAVPFRSACKMAKDMDAERLFKVLFLKNTYEIPAVPEPQSKAQ